MYDGQSLKGLSRELGSMTDRDWLYFMRTIDAALCIDVVSGADSWWTVQRDMEEASTVILGVSRDGCVFHDGLRSDLRWFSFQRS